MNGVGWGAGRCLLASWAMLSCWWFGPAVAAQTDAERSAAAPATSTPADPESAAGTTAGAPPTTAPEGLGHRRIERQLAWLRELIIGLRETRPDLFNGESLGRQTRAPARGAQPMDKAAAALEQELALLERTVLALRRSQGQLGAGISNGRDVYGPPNEAGAHELPERVAHWRILGDGEDTFELSGPVTNVWWELVNISDTTVQVPRLAINGFGGWRNMHEIVEVALDGAVDPRQQAENIWAFVVGHRYHSDPASGGIECHDPVKLLNVYGYGFCDDAANVYAAIARAAGFDARLWGLGGHVVPELYYDERWHMFDPDNEVWYDDGEGRVASVEQLVTNPALLSTPTLASGRTSSYYGPGWAEPIFASRGDNRLASYAEVTRTHTMDWVLRPGESVRLWHGDRALRFTSGYLERASLVGNGEWRLQRELAPGETSFELEFRLPWPTLSGTVSLSAVGPQTRLEVQLDGQRFELSPTVSHGEDGSATGGRFELAGLFAVGTDTPDYRVSMKLTGLPAEGSALKVALQFQHAPRALPGLSTGVNEITCVGLSPGARLLLRLAYQQDDGEAAPQLFSVRDIPRR